MLKPKILLQDLQAYDAKSQLRDEVQYKTDPEGEEQQTAGSCKLPLEMTIGLAVDTSNARVSGTGLLRKLSCAAMQLERLMS